MAQSLLLYGESSTFKTTQIGLFADYQFARTGLPTRLITCDSGVGPCADQVSRGTLIPLSLKHSPIPIAAINKIAKGMWPKNVIDLESGIWEMDQASNFEPCLTNTGAYAVEGLDRLCELASKAWTMDNQRGSPRGIFEEMGEKFSFRSQSIYGDIQQFIGNVVLYFGGLNVDRVLFTAHESKGKDLSGKTTFGPATMGPALTDKVAGWFEITLHHESYMYTAKGKSGKSVVRSGVRAYFQRHQDSEVKGMYWPAKLGNTPMLTTR